MEKLNGLINQVSTILLKEKTQQEERRKRGECFNIFEVLGLQTSEVRLHSAIIAQLLKPDGNHGLSDKFLKAFVEDVIQKQKHFEMDFASAKVDVEYPIGSISEDYTEGGRIDILVRDKDRQTIIIENKIYAGDQPCQLLRYNNYACKTEGLPNDKYIILYLTLYDGNQSSEESTGKEAFEYFCISYKTEILTWLEHCLELSVRHPLVRETIQQYIINLKSILSIMENDNKQELLETMVANPDVVAAICNAQEDYKKYVYKTFVKPELENLASVRKLIFKDFNLFGSGERGYCFYREEWKSSAVSIWTERRGEWDFYWGISNYQGGPLNVEKHKVSWLENQPTDWWPYGWEHLGKYKDWRNMETISEMVKGNYTKYIIGLVDKALKEIDKDKLPMP